MLQRMSLHSVEPIECLLYAGRNSSNYYKNRFVSSSRDLGIYQIPNANNNSFIYSLKLFLQIFLRYIYIYIYSVIWFCKCSSSTERERERETTAPHSIKRSFLYISAQQEINIADFIQSPRFSWNHKLAGMWHLDRSKKKKKKKKTTE